MKFITALIWLWCGWPAAALAAGQSPTAKAPAQNTPPPPAGAAPMTDIHDIKPLIAMGPDLRWLYWVLGLTVLAALLGLAWWLWRRRKPAGNLETEIARPAPEVEAYQLLDALAAGDLGDMKRFYFQLSAILRQYMERRFNIPAVEMTTEELLPQARRLALEPELTRAFQAFCQSTDPIKFAGRIVRPEQLPRDLAFVRSFVQQTTNPPAQPPAEAPVDAASKERAISGDQIPRLALDRRPENPGRKMMD